MPTWLALTFQDSTAPFMENILFFHDHAMIVLSLITVLTVYLTVSLFLSKKFNKFSSESQEIETIWTIIPALLLVFIAFPSMKTLYLMEDSKTPTLSVKTSGHQWYWSYEHSTFNEKEMESFMESSKITRLLKTSEILKVPTLSLIRMLITSQDVIHSWTIPSMGVKVDALPGRINQIFILSKRIGLYTGQCSEICGMNHSFMPILMQYYSPSEFIKTF